jgi:4,5-DOPA dioxygenase extradiol
MPDGGFDWAQRFDADARDTMLDDPLNAARLDGHRDFRHAVPTADHFLPLLYLAGLAGASRQGADVLVDGCAYGSLSMTAYTLGLGPGTTSATGASAASIPPGLPPDGVNI